MPAPRTSRAPARPRSSRASHSWQDVPLAPVVLVTGAEDLLAERAVARVLGLARERDGAIEVTTIEGSAYTAGTLHVVTSPSLFGEAQVVVIEHVEQASDDLIADAVAYCAQPEQDAVVVLRHGGGVRGKKLLDAARAADVPEVTCEAIKKDADKAAFVSAEMKRHGRRASADAVRALVEAVGADLRELAAACAQLASDTAGAIGPETVERYYGGRVEATGFRVADAAVEGRTDEAVVLLRHALATGVDPVPLVAALAVKLRTLAKVAAMRGRGGSAGSLGLAPWQVERAQRDLRRWTPEGLARAILAVAQADAEVKGASRDPLFAVERAVLRVAEAASSRA